MKWEPEFALLPLDRLHSHERIEPHKVDELVAEIRSSGVFSDPIWVARDSHVILNGHHRAEALRRLGGIRIPAWIFDYGSEHVALGRWRPGPRLTKEDVVRRAHAGELFPPKTTRHRLLIELPARPTPLAELLPKPRQVRASKPSRRRAGGASGAG